MSPSDRVAQLYPQAAGSLFIAFYGSPHGNKCYSVKDNMNMDLREIDFEFGTKSKWGQIVYFFNT
jgi:hypothetical protein